MGNPYYAYPNPIFQPAMRIIQNITNAPLAVVTTTFPHLYITGTIVRLDIPQIFGMNQANQLTGTINVTGPDTFLIDIDTTIFEPFLNFALWPVRATSYPNVVAIGEDNDILTAAVQNTLIS
jgi:hypothetical protein